MRVEPDKAKVGEKFDEKKELVALCFQTDVLLSFCKR